MRDTRTTRRLCDSFFAMTDTNVPTIENLIQICRDSEEGFAAAAGAATNPELQHLFEEYSRQRLQFARDLQGEGLIFGEKEPTDSGTLNGSARRAWMKVRNALGTLDDSAILEECEREDTAAVEAYRAALEAPGLADCLRDTVAAQFTEVVAAHRRVRELREGVATGA